MLVILREEHDALRRIMHEFSAIICGPLPDNLSAFTKIRMEFSSLFRSHSVAEQDYIRPFQKSTSAPIRAVIEDHSRRFHQLYFEYSNHIALWRPDRIRQEWSAYGQAACDLQKALLAMLDWEETEILPLLAAGQSGPERFASMAGFALRRA